MRARGVEDSGFGFSGLGFKVQGSGFRVQSLSFRVEFMVWDSGVTGVPHVQKTQLRKTHRIRPMCFLGFLTKHRHDSPSVFLMQENVGPTEFSVPLRINIVLEFEVPLYTTCRVGLPFLHVLLKQSLHGGGYTPAESVAIRASLSRLQGFGFGGVHERKLRVVGL